MVPDSLRTDLIRSPPATGRPTPSAHPRPRTGEVPTTTRFEPIVPRCPSRTPRRSPPSWVTSRTSALARKSSGSSPPTRAPSRTYAWSATATPTDRAGTSSSSKTSRALSARSRSTSTTWAGGRCGSTSRRDGRIAGISLGAGAGSPTATTNATDDAGAVDSRTATTTSVARRLPLDLTASDLTTAGASVAGRVAPVTRRLDPTAVPASAAATNQRRRSPAAATTPRAVAVASDGRSIAIRPTRPRPRDGRSWSSSPGPPTPTPSPSTFNPTRPSPTLSDPRSPSIPPPRSRRLSVRSRRRRTGSTPRLASSRRARCPRPSRCPSPRCSRTPSAGLFCWRRSKTRRSKPRTFSRC